MFPSNSSLNGNDPVAYCDQAFSCRPVFCDSNPNPKRDNAFAPTSLRLPTLSFLHFPSPFEDDEFFLQQHHHDLLVHHQSLSEAVNVGVEVTTKIPNKGHRMSMEQIPRRKPCKRDRHSKIKTARGLRDRRMRLSLEVARNFFGLQDMLGFDKASKTVEWLLNQAKDDIKHLATDQNNHLSTAGVKSASSTSECEGVSGLDEVAVSGNREQDGKPSAKKRIKHSRKNAFHPIARESREKARERARERTKEKMRSRRLADESKTEQCSDEKNNCLSRLGSWNPFETREESHTQSRNVNLSLDVMTEAEDPSSQAKEHLGTIDDMVHDDSLLIMSKWSPSMIFNSLANSGFMQHQFAEFQSLGKPWEAYNNNI
ncbi:hypothetical protein L6164_011323 [Bauhinia variegata]|uniref:Uncharacterized protein n=1 Tax=Bauhinia variegata TaxID=167791 RepID=A0ACB9P848_BAUVA|nr:hypothetical protein L6164_011323 [Bauhinia variegata]